MSSDKRSETRYITILPLCLLNDAGQVVDSTATAHDLTSGGFKAECQTELPLGQVFAFTLDLPDGQPPARGRAKAVWVKKHDFATWIGGQIVSMPWADKRRLKKVLAPPNVEWGPLIDNILNALVWVVVALALQRVLFEPARRETLLGLLPTLFALTVMGWALLSFVRRR